MPKRPSGDAENRGCKLPYPISNRGKLTFAGKKFVLTGKMMSLTRDDAIFLIENKYGGKVMSAVSNKTNYLLTGHILEDGRDITTSSKYKKAIELKKGNVRILTEDDFFQLIRDSSSDSSKSSETTTTTTSNTNNNNNNNNNANLKNITSSILLSNTTTTSTTHKCVTPLVPSSSSSSSSLAMREKKLEELKKMVEREQILIEEEKSQSQGQRIALQPIINNDDNNMEDSIFTPPDSFIPSQNSFTSDSTITTTAKNKNNSKNKNNNNNQKNNNKMILSVEQQKVLDLVIKDGENVFFTGSAGTGKSFLISQIVEKVSQNKKGRKQKKNIHVTASTGIAAVNIGGTTLHSFAGIGLGLLEVGALVNIVKRNPMSKQRWQECDVLIIDEISMINGDLFDKLEAIARAMKGNAKPFGGIQLILCGDIFQLPPVAKDKKQQKWIFDALSFHRCVPSSRNIIEMQKIFRQSELTLVNLLQNMRLGQLSKRDLNLIQKLSRPISPPEGILPTRLFTINLSVNETNRNSLLELKGKDHYYEAQDNDYNNPRNFEKFARNCQAEKSLHLRVGAQVMLLRNNINGNKNLVNGSRGIVLRFKTHKRVLDKHGDEIEVDKNVTFHDGKDYPLVQFATGEPELIGEMAFTHSVKEGKTVKILASRDQIPLKLAWAVTVHKSQGMSIDYVEADMAGVFEDGQAYVALSRCTHLAGLRVLNFDPATVKVNQKAKDFYDAHFAKISDTAANNNAKRPNQLLSPSLSSSSSSSSSPALGSSSKKPRLS